MKRLSSLLIIMSAAALSAFAVHVTPDQALRRVTQRSGDVPVRLQKRISAETNYRLADTRSADGKEQLYLFQGDNGFLLLPADNNIKPLLGYGDGAAVKDDGTIPDNFAYWLDFMSRRMAQALANPGLRAPADRTFGVTREPIGPLCTTQWNQDNPYNNNCPWDDTLNERSVTGCVATATAQVMKYHNWPKQGYESNEYTTRTREWTFTTDFSDYTFDWDNMLDSYEKRAPRNQREAVANLMDAVGRAVQMDYTADQSGAYAVHIGYALWKYFGYDNTVNYIMRDYYPLAKWEEIIYNTLREYGPVIYDGQSSGGGHCFVCDGYSDGLFHINWGWGGMSDGYFELDVLDPVSQGIGGSDYDFNSNQDAVIGVRPYRDGRQATPDHFAMWGQSELKMEPLDSELTAGDTFTSSCPFYNFGPFEIPENFNVGMVFRDMYNDTETFDYATVDESLPILYGFDEEQMEYQVADTLKNGVYRLFLALETGTGCRTPVRLYEQFNPYYIATVTDGKLRISEMRSILPDVMDIAYPDHLNLNEPDAAIETILRNYKSQDIKGSIRAELIRDGVVLAATEPEDVTIPACGELEYSHVIGTNLMKIGEDNTGDSRLAGNRKGASERALDITPGEAIVALSILNGNGVYMPLSGGKTIRLENIPSGIVNVGNSANADVEYYTLQGLRVAERPAGPHIERRGGRMVKVIR